MRYFYRIAVNCFLITIAIGIAMNIAGFIAGSGVSADYFNGLPPLIRIPFGIIGAFSAVGIITVWVGMIVDCLGFTKMSVTSKIGWLLLLLLTNMLGALIYYYAVFDKRVTRKDRRPASIRT
ncbi:MAG: PLDc N-terminal domain-containing protein [Acidobacteriaceae bacterium]